MEQINSTPTAFQDEQSPGVKSDHTRQNGSILTPILNVFSTEKDENTPEQTINEKIKQQLDDIESVDELDDVTNTEEPILPQSNRSTTRDLLKSSMKTNDKKVEDKSPTNSFLDFMCQYQNENKTATKSLAYDNFHIKKIRALYGRRGTLDIKQIQQKISEQQRQKEQDRLGIEGDMARLRDNKNQDSHVKNKENEKEVEAEDAMPADASIFIKMIIHPDSSWKALFDVWILLLVGYSCISNIYFTAFSVEKTTLTGIIFWIVEVFFYFDFAFSWFQGYRDEQDHKCVWDYQMIAESYLKGWFFIDFISIFPFQLVVGEGNASATKLFRMPRMLRMGKLLDMKNVKRLMKSFQGPIEGANDIINLYNRLFAYKMMRLLIVLVILTYFQGCLWFLFSKSSAPDNGRTWYKEFGLEDYNTTDQLITSLYFALTMLSTVGYGDLYPISNAEMVVGVLLMMIGVSVFSIVMGQFEETQDDFQTQMGDPNYREQLLRWMLGLQRFRNRQPIPPSIAWAIEDDYNFYMEFDRNQYFTDQSNASVKDLPIKIKSKIAVQYLYGDMIDKYRRFFDNTKYPGSDQQNDALIYHLTTGLIPRRFRNNSVDFIIYDEYQEVDEMYMIWDGQIGIGYAQPCAGVDQKPYKWVKCQQGRQIICDHYVINKQKSQWIYGALEDVKCYALKRQYMHEVIFPKYPDFYTQVSSESYNFYKNWIYKPISREREEDIKKKNQVRYLYNQINVNDKVAMRKPIPSRTEYMDFVKYQHMIKQKVKRDMANKIKSLSGNTNRKSKGGSSMHFAIAKPKPTPIQTSGTTKLFGITENCTPGEPLASIPDQYDELKRQEELQTNFYPELDRICSTMHAKTCDDIKNNFNKNNGIFIRFVDKLRMMTECNNLRGLNKH